jgi:4-aminobutyrate aminotransferase-like enzyme
MSKARDLANAADVLDDVSATELGYLDGVTSAIQTQLDAKTAKSTLTTTGDIYYASAANTPARLGIGTASQVLQVNSGATAPEWATPASPSPTSASSTVASYQSTSSISYTDLATTTAVTLTTGTKVLVIVTAYTYSGDNPCGIFMDYAVSGATTRAASDSTAFRTQRSNADVRVRASSVSRITVTAGSNTFTAKYKTTSLATAYIVDREILVIDLGS